MTTEEIIKTLKSAQAEVEWDYQMDYAAAIDEAIEAVYVRDEVERIDRETSAYAVLSKHTFQYALRKAKDRANPKHYWIVFGDLLKCPVCGRCFKDAYDFDNCDAYCRHCGTKMEGIKQ